MQAPAPNHRRVLLAVFLLALAVRIALILLRPPGTDEVLTHLNDSTDYDLLARNIAAGNGFVNQLGNPTVLRPPVYPLFLAIVYTVTGAGNLTAVALCQALLGALNSVLTIRLTHRAGLGSAASLLAGIIAALYPAFIFQTTLILTEVFHRTLLLAWALAMITSINSPRHAPRIIAGVLYAACLLSKPAMLATIPFVALWLLLAEAAPWKQRIACALIVLITAGALTGAWTARNAAVSGAFVPVAANFDVTSAHGTSRFGYYAARWYGPERLLPVPDDFLWLTQLRAYSDAREEVAIQAEWRDRLRAFNAANPALHLQLSIRRALHFWSPLINNPNRVASLAALLTMGPVLLLGSIGIIRALNAANPARHLALLCLAVAIPVTIPHALSMPDVRYRTPFVDPLWIPFAAAVSVQCWQRLTSRTN